MLPHLMWEFIVYFNSCVHYAFFKDTSSAKLNMEIWALACIMVLGFCIFLKLSVFIFI